MIVSDLCHSCHVTTHQSVTPGAAGASRVTRTRDVGAAPAPMDAAKACALGGRDHTYTYSAERRHRDRWRQSLNEGQDVACARGRGMQHRQQASSCIKHATGESNAHTVCAACGDISSMWVCCTGQQPPSMSARVQQGRSRGCDSRVQCLGKCGRRAQPRGARAQERVLCVGRRTVKNQTHVCNYARPLGQRMSACVDRAAAIKSESRARQQAFKGGSLGPNVALAGQGSREAKPCRTRGRRRKAAGEPSPHGPMGPAAGAQKLPVAVPSSGVGSEPS